MIYNLSKIPDKEAAKVRFEYLLKNDSIIELSLKRQKRTVSQNSYLHVLFSLFGIEFGYSIDETKTLIKRELKYYYKKNNQIFLKKTSYADTKELTNFIEKFRNYSAKNGFYLPSSKEYLTNYVEFEQRIINNEIYL